RRRQEDGEMRRAIIALVTAATLTMTGLTFGPALKATALGETSVTLSCDDGTSLTLLVDVNMLAGLIAAVQGMIDYPAGLGCIWVNIGVNLHVTGNGTLQGSLNETIPENQSCTDGNGTTIAVGPSHFTSKPTPPNTDLVGCLHVNPTTSQASVITYVTQISGLETFPGSGVAQGFFVGVGSEIHASFLDGPGSPSQQTPPEQRDHLNAPPAADDADC